MTTDKIRVTVDGEPVTREVSLDQVRAYLTRKGWVCVERSAREQWSPSARAPLVVSLSHRSNFLRWAVERIATHEQRHPAEVLCEIAGPSTAPRVDEMMGMSREWTKRQDGQVTIYQRAAKQWDDDSRGHREQRLVARSDGEMVLEEWYEPYDPPPWQESVGATLPRWDVARGDREAALWSLVRQLATDAPRIVTTREVRLEQVLRKIADEGKPPPSTVDPLSAEELDALEAQARKDAGAVPMIGRLLATIRALEEECETRGQRALRRYRRGGRGNEASRRTDP